MKKIFVAEVENTYIERNFIEHQYKRPSKNCQSDS